MTAEPLAELPVREPGRGDWPGLPGLAEPADRAGAAGRVRPPDGEHRSRRGGPVDPLVQPEEALARMRERAESREPSSLDWGAYKFDVQVLAIGLAHTLALHPADEHHGCPTTPCTTRYRISRDLAQGWHDW